MIDAPSPRDWRELQAGVCRLLTEIGLTSQTERSLSTPRGLVVGPCEGLPGAEDDD